MPPGKKKAPETLDDVLDDIRKEHGTGSIMRLGDTPLEPVEVISSGSVVLNEALGLGGFPRGRIIEVYGPESSGKTSIALHALAQAQKAGLVGAFIDAEHAFSMEWAAKLGVNTGQLFFSQPDNGEQGLDITQRLTNSGKVGIIIIDSVAALTPKAEIEGEMGDSHVGLQARLMSQALRKLNGSASTTKTTLVFINQLREKIGIMWGNPETTPGGKALKFYSSVRLDVRRRDSIKEGSITVGHNVKVTVVKNKVAPPGRIAEMAFYYTGGISVAAELIELAVTRGVITKAGAWHVYGGEKIGNGKDATRRELEENPALLEEISQKVTAAAGTVVPQVKQDKLGLDGPNPWDAGDA